MSKSTYDFFSEKFRQNLPNSATAAEAFDRATEQIGFSPYKDYDSFRVVRSRERNKKKRG